ncbi:hypothetical protein CYLTODRAFT_419744 [Cylindrobasidium torrendii FP15055 ss-10]|uniref:Uncharacterized protein n=1 Tax=Cylindrobasidium torrendii FP15055 ss-10 TaxID=1314674 RepID=A0A0D7BLP7_9AGAR|nr:hypothetical protein CYLTODRAFT_419744 [Cylindrobasidium torrendii FP15055 ss-10]
MCTPYRSQDISTCPIFVDPVQYQLIDSHEPITHFEYMLGLGKRELRYNLDCTENALLVQPCMHEYFVRKQLYLLPEEDVCKKMLNVARHNVSCLPSERVLFSDIPDFSADQCYYKLDHKDPSWDEKTLLYTRHPITGHVTTHTAPYPSLPTFSISASPWMAAMAARLAFTMANTRDTIPRIHIAMFSRRPPESFQVAPPPNVTLSPSVYKSILSPPAAVCQIPRASPSPRTSSKRAYHHFAGSDESSRSSDDEVRPPKRTRKTRAATSRTAQTAAAPRTRARCRAQAVH